jgi:lysophospholipase L1-like esterase
VDSGDDNLHYADGQDLFGADLVDEYLPDALHPSGDGYEVMGRNFVRLVQAGPLKGVAPV